MWYHIVPQIITANNPATKQQSIEIAIDRLGGDENLQDKLAEQNIELIDFHRILAEILAADPIIGIPIDRITNALHEWVATLKVNV